VAEWRIGQSTFQILRGNLAEQSVEAVALDVGTDWMPAGPASGAVFGAAGGALGDEAATLTNGEPGEVTRVPGHELPAENIYLVAMAPERNLENPDSFLRECYENLFDSISANAGRELALPPLGLGDFEVSIDRTARIGIETIRARLTDGDPPGDVSLVVYDAIEFSSVENFGETIIEDEEVDRDPEQQLRDYY